MVTFLRYCFWPLLWLLVAILGFVFDPRFWGNAILWFAADPWNHFLQLLSVYLGWKLSVRWVRSFYAWAKSRHLVYLKVVLPRSDSKVDQEKRTEKDWKEKVAVMEQLYRALWEVKSLTFWQTLHYWVLRYIVISFEMYVHKGELLFYVVTQPQFVSIVEKQITAYYNDAEVTVEPPPVLRPKGYAFIGYNVVHSKKYVYPIRCYDQMQDDPLNDLGNVMSKLNPDEIAGIQVVLQPSFSNKWGKRAKQFASQGFKGKKEHWIEKIPIFGRLFSFFLPRGDGSTFAPGATSGDKFVRMVQPEEELFKRIAEKGGMSWYHCSIRMFASSPTWPRALDISNNLQVAFNVFKDLYGNSFVNRRMFFEIFPLAFNAPIVAWLWKHRLNGFYHKHCLLAEKELAGLFHFPDSRYNKMPIIHWISYKVLPPPPNAPKEGVVLGVNRYRAHETKVHFLPKDRTRHQYIIGKSGCGKSSLLSWQARQDVHNGEGVCVVDPHGDLIADVLAHVPKERAKHIVLFDPADTERPMGLNLLEAKTDKEKDRASIDAMEIFIKLFGNHCGSSAGS